jgi:hypothetical protein
MEMKKSQKSQKNQCFYECKSCNYITSNKYDYIKHTLTAKHLNQQKYRAMEIDGNEKIAANTCSQCMKSFTTKSGLWKHIQKCSTPNENIQDNKIVENKATSDLFLQAMNRTNELQEAFLEQNRELQNKLLEKENYIIEQNNKLLELSGKTTYNTINNQFNLNVYLNETCKDAMNIVDFVNSLKLTIEDFETTGKLGFVDGISRIIIKELKNLDTEKMPIHCTDLKRETLYIKDNDKWEKENDEKRRFKWAINRIAQLNLNQLQNWQLAYPESVINNTPANEKFTELALVALGGRGEEQENKFREKIMKNVLKEVVLDKKGISK